MIRIVLESFLLFLLPAAIYFGYIWLTRDPDKDGGAIIDEAPLVWLAVAGAAMVFVVMVFFASYSGGKPGQGYTPPVYKDGKIVPGQLEKNE